MGSKALFDDVNLLGFNGLPLYSAPSMTVKLSPNPAIDYLKFDLGRNVNGYFEVYDAQAKLIRQVAVSGNTGQVNVSDLNAAMYYYKLTESAKLLNSGTFMVTK